MSCPSIRMPHFGSVLLVALALIGCASPPPRPIDRRPPPAAPAPAPAPIAPPAPRTVPTDTTPPPPPSLPPVADAPSTAAPPVAAEPSEAIEPPLPLAAEHDWLADLFAGTPVGVSAEAGDMVRLEVPLEFAFDDGSAQPKPPLQVVLQRLQQSLQRQPSARLAVAAPGPDAAQRRRSMRALLVAMGLPSYRVSATLPAAAYDSVSLRLFLAPTAVQQLEDDDLPALSPARSPAGIKPPAER